jgi:hypothetical protein
VPEEPVADVANADDVADAEFTLHEAERREGLNLTQHEDIGLAFMSELTRAAIWPSPVID